MTAQVFRTQQRAPGPELPSGDVALEPPPALTPPQRIGLLRLVMFLPMLLMPAGMILMYTAGGSFGVASIGASFMGMSMVGMMLPQMMRGSIDARNNVDDDRSDYLRYLASERKKLREALEQQRAAIAWNNPDPRMLVFRARTKRLWERQPSDEDFGETRVGVGNQPCAMALTPPEIIPLEELEPVSALALRRLIETFSTVPGLPVAISLSGFARIQLGGDPELCRGLARATLAQLVTAHSPEFVRIALCTDIDRQGDWDWVKWLPHGQHPTATDGAGSRRLFASTIRDLERDVLGDMIIHRPRFEPHAVPSAEDPLLVLVVDGAAIPPSSRLATSGYRGLVVLDVGDALPWRQDRNALRLNVQEGDLAMVVTGKDGEDMEEVLGAPDALALPLVTALARRLARWRIPGDGSSGSAEGTASARPIELSELLGIVDVRDFDPHEYWRAHGPNGKLRVPIGMDEIGSPVELDIRESAQGGMGPHGMLVGATGSGKSELLRTLVLAMAVRHSSEYLNFVLADFKGGATFVGLDRLPHTSALITNLAEELTLVDRMQDAIHGELVRRQELLRATGYASLQEYERARAGGTQLAPLPTLFLVIDEFSELLTARREFINLFVMVGRLGRSLGVHLLLATQRLEEGRVHQLEGHLSYRIGLRMFSASESRQVLGITDAYETPLAPGQGFLKTSTSAIQKFRAAYVSGQLKLAGPERSQAKAERLLRNDLTSFSLPFLPPPQPLEPEEEPDEEDEEPEDEVDAPADSRENTILHHLLERLTNSGPAAHRVWLPPLSEPPTLDGLLGGLKHDGERGLTAAGWQGPLLSVPVGIIDRPFEQRWDLLTVELDGASGHVGIVGAPQSGKSTLVRTLITALALTATPKQARFYCLDFSGGGLASLGGLPHVGSVATRRDTDLVNRTLVELVELLDRRERLFTSLRLDGMTDARRLRDEGRAPDEDDLADVFLVVDGWFTVKQDFEHLDAHFQQLAQRGLNAGVHLVVASSRWSEFRMWLRDVLGTKLELHLNDPSDSAIGMRVAANVPNLPGRGLTEDSMHFLAALPRIDGVTDRESLTQGSGQAVAAIASAWKGESAPSVRTLPALVRFDELPEPEGGPTSKDDLRVPIGIDEHTGDPYWWDFGQHPHLVAFGDTETGKTTLLRLILRAITQRYEPRQAKVVLGDFRRELYDTVPKESLLGYATNEKSLNDILAEGIPALTDRVPSDDLPQDALRRRDWWEGPRVFVVVDDLDLLASGNFGSPSPLAALPPFIPHGADIGLHLVLTRATAQGSRGVNDPAVRKIWDTGMPALLFSCPREEGIIFGTTRPATLPPGRAQLITRRGSHLVQVAYVPDGPRADRS